MMIFDLFYVSTISPQLIHTIALLFYTDPGSGALIWQLITASFVGGTFYIVFTVRRIKMFFVKMLRRPETKVVRSDTL